MRVALAICLKAPAPHSNTIDPSLPVDTDYSKPVQKVPGPQGVGNYFRRLLWSVDQVHKKKPYVLLIALFSFVLYSLKNFGEFNMWLAAKNGMFLRSPKGTWMTTMPVHSTMEWVDSVKIRMMIENRTGVWHII
uniref:Alpha,alpha-trehalose-phosphate synthase [UDP-forming] 1-like n=1 Tax=Tanacetum cinerariifolium TaxID=118510 RepID=A0A699KFM7_TANCI|nr:alpha,alpha-trehalose-phosphate synthase [UDP-forming] 1-like [Tanacetum cinerariifolium]